MAENKFLNKSLKDLLEDQNLQAKVNILEKNASKTYVDISLVHPNPYQPRTEFDEIKLNELAESIKQYGVFNPIIVRPKDNGYEIVAGERRYRASKIAKLDKIPVIIENFSDQEMSEIALIENIQREDLSPLEIAIGLKNYQDEFGLTQYELASKMGKSRSYIANILRLNNLPKSIKEEVKNGNLSVGHVRTLIGLTEDEALEYLKQIKSNKMNVRETEELVQTIKNNRDTKKKISVENDLKTKLKTNVKLTKSQIKIDFNSPEELEEILKTLMGKNN